MNRYLWIPLVALVCVFAGCGQKPWVGQWRGVKTVDKVHMDIDLTLKSDGTFLMNQTATLKGNARNRGMAGYYTAQNESLIFTVTTITIDNKTVKTAEYQPPQPFTVKDDKLTYGKDKGEIVLTRVKANKKK